MIGLAAVDDDRMLLSGLAAWLAAAADLRLVAASDTVDGLLGHGTDGIDVVLLDLLLADRSNPADNVRRLAAAGPRVLVVSVVADPDQVMAAYAAGAAGYLTKDRDLDEVAPTVRGVASGSDPCPSELAFAIAHDQRPGRPRLSLRERQLLLAYAAGMTLDAAARRIGIRPATAKHYLERIKQKYRSAGRPN
jgi:two-component system, NarL family, nitrate/nitrite response regulator NarL